MKVNAGTILVGERVTLVPYLHEHVPTYNAWMQSAELLALTASEPLTLDEEYANQLSWRDDESKLTFIVCDRARPDTPGCMSTVGSGAMVGDVNLFFNDYEDAHAAEIEVMIADADSRGKGLGSEAVRLMMSYAVQRALATSFIVKIGASNAASMGMFTKLGFGDFEHLEWCDEHHGRFMGAIDELARVPLVEQSL